MGEIDKIIGRRIEKGRRRRGLLQHELGAAVGRSESWVSQVERGVIALDSVSMAERIAATLGLPVGQILAFDVRYRAAAPAVPPARPRSSPAHPLSPDRPGDEASSDAVLRRSFTLGSLAGLTAAIAGLSPDARAQVNRPSGGIVDRVTVSELRAIGASYRRSYKSFPASSLVPVARDQVQLVLSLRPRDQPAEVRYSLLAHMAEMAALASALLSLDLGDPGQADAYMDLGYQIAKEIGSPELAALIMAGRAFRASFSGDLDGGLDYALAAVDAAERGASRRMWAWTNAVASEMYSGMGDVQGVRACLEQARILLTGPMDDERWGGIAWFDLSKADAYEGSNLVRLGRHTEALPALDKAIESLSPEMLRHRCTAHISRAEAHAGAGNIEAACDDGHAALALVAQVQHRETLRRVTALHRDVRIHQTAGTRSLGEHLIDTRALLKTTGSVV
ncbi:helix-turn-helix domain-containing protein [Actinoplanes flavus]|uniref:Helix-turn-helix domain-containing protein n=1 Tax=Actinoplanes flavus TaxID=2820290 RepID=A0ABS3UT53_9ACTN|nr:helix-turn-helix transcriptional regulator [Actinoplanes flavus]MBO3741755.1 helix-turn-helix domain-containing protein [Actinoplanes flavus]